MASTWPPAHPVTTPHSVSVAISALVSRGALQCCTHDLYRSGMQQGPSGPTLGDSPNQQHGTAPRTHTICLHACSLGAGKPAPLVYVARIWQVRSISHPRCHRAPSSCGSAWRGQTDNHKARERAWPVWGAASSWIAPCLCHAPAPILEAVRA